MAIVVCQLDHPRENPRHNTPCNQRTPRVRQRKGPAKPLALVRGPSSRSQTLVCAPGANTQKMNRAGRGHSLTLEARIPGRIDPAFSPTPTVFLQVHRLTAARRLPAPRRCIGSSTQRRRIDSASTESRLWLRHHSQHLLDIGMLCLVPDTGTTGASALATRSYHARPSLRESPSNSTLGRPAQTKECPPESAPDCPPGKDASLNRPA